MEEAGEKRGVAGGCVLQGELGVCGSEYGAYVSQVGIDE